MSFTNYVFTRFNLGLYSENPYKINNPDEWMEHRIDLFLQHCLPSMRQQTASFIWVMAFDRKTKDIHLGQLDHFDRIPVIFVFDMQPHEWLREQEPRTPWLITTRLDNDDLLYPNAIESIQANFRQQIEIIDIDYRVVYIATGLAFPSNRPKANSPFLSLVEPWSNNIMTAMGRPHSIMTDLYPSRKLGVLADQIIHDRNIKNQIP